MLVTSFGLRHSLGENAGALLEGELERNLILGGEVIVGPLSPGKRFRVVGWKITGHGVREQKEWELLEVGVPRCMESGQHAPILVDVSLIGQPFVDQVCGGCGRQMSRRRIDL